jgi:hypothetical protein
MTFVEKCSLTGQKPEGSEYESLYILSIGIPGKTRKLFLITTFLRKGE